MRRYEAELNVSVYTGMSKAFSPCLMLSVLVCVCLGVEGLPGLHGRVGIIVGRRQEFHPSSDAADFGL